MVKRNKNYHIIIMILLVVGLTSCSSAPPVYISNSPISSSQSSTQRKVGTAILSASRFYEEWNIRKIRPGEMKSILSYGQHTATVSIPYEANNFHIIYQSSDNFSYDKEDQTIHPRYNYWVKRLENRIHEEIQYHLQLSEENLSEEKQEFRDE